MNKEFVPKGATHRHIHIDDNRKYEKWIKHKYKTIIYTWDGSWVYYDTFIRSDKKLISLRVKL